MDNNYEAQKQFTSQRLAARREQAAAERLLKEGRRERNGRLKQLLYLFRRSRRPEKHTGAQKSTPARLAISAKGKQ